MTSPRPDAIVPRRGHGPVPLSSAQERLWFLEQLLPGTAVHNVPVAVRLAGELDLARLRGAVATLAARHETLRTWFGRDASGAPVQHVADHVEVPVAVVEAADLDAAIAAEIEAPFDLTRAPLIRAKLFRVAPEEHVFVLTLHHIVSDGWSIGVVIRELTALYFGEGLAPLDVQYADFALWQHAREDDPRALAYWREQLAGLSPALALPTDRPRPEQPTFIGGRASATLPAELTTAVKALGRGEGATLFMTLLAAFDALLHRCTGQNDIVVGTPIANRNQLRTEGLVGFFVNALPLRVDVSGDPSFRELLRRARKTALAGYAHQDLPFDRLVEELRPDRKITQAPLFSVALVLQNAPSGPLRLPGLEVTPLELHTRTTKFDICLALTERDGALLAQLEYDAELFDHASAERLLARFERLLGSVVVEPDARLSRLDVLVPGERAAALAAGRRRAEHAVEQCLHERFAAQAARTPERIALSFEGAELTYAELDRRADELAAHLRALGVGPDVLVALLFERSLEMVVAILGVLKAGGAYVPLDPTYPEARLAAVLGDSVPAVLVTNTAAPAFRGPVVELGETITVHGDGRALETTRAASPDDLAYVIYTSGSTGRPKGVLISHRNVMRLFASSERGFDFGQDDVWTLFHSYAFDFSVWELWGALLYGGRLVIVPRETARGADAFHALLREHGVTVLNQTPSAFAQLVAADARRPADELALRLVIFGGEALDPRMLRPWIERHGDAEPRLVNMYGITETTVHVTQRDVTAADTANARSPIGEPLDDLSLYVLDSALQPVPAGVAGELCVGGAGLALGYLGAPELTTARFVPDPFSSAPGARLYRSGDRARRGPDGELEYLGRGDDQVKVRGFRIELGDIEAALAEHPAVESAVAAVVESADGDKRVAAYVVTDPAYGATGDDGDEIAQAESWRLVFDQTYDGGGAEDLAFDISGWNTSADNSPIPADEMREWVDGRVERIRALRPRRVLELGCGTGLLVHRLAPECEAYVATDLSRQAIYALERAALPNVELRHQPADDLTGIECGSFDVVVINSVSQYLPSAGYLERVLTQAVSALSPGGRVFVGDVRNLGLLEAFHAWAELHRTADDVPVAHLRAQVLRRAAEEDELLLAPDYFRALAAKLGVGVEFQLLADRARNEMSLFRYDAILGGTQVAPTGPRVDDLEALRWTLEHDRPPAITLAGARNAHVSASVEAVRLLSALPHGARVGELRRALATADAGLDPADVIALARECGYEAHVRWTADPADGCFDAVLVRAGAAPAPAAEPPALSSGPHASDPLNARRRRALLTQLRAWAGERLPEHMVPAAVVGIQALPLTPNGKLDRAALPPLDVERPRLDAGYVAPGTEAEKVVAAACAELLGVGDVGAQDNFFALGGHSLLATQLLFRLRDTFGLELPLRTLFETPTVAGIAAALERGQGAAELDLPSYVTLDPEIAAAPQRPARGHVLLTGATGFLGAFLLRELIRQTDAVVHCLVRAADAGEARRRMRRTLERYELRDPGLYGARVRAIPGDLAQPGLGLEPAQLDALAERIDAIYHNGAAVNLVEPYAQLAPANVAGTTEIVALAARAGIPLHYVSTVGVFAPRNDVGEIGEDEPLGDGSGLQHGYTQSKWVAEQVVRLAAGRGVRTAIYRPSRVSGDSTSGVCQDHDFLWRVVKGCIEASAAPDVDAPIDLVPVDYVSRALVVLSLREPADGPAYHLVSPRPQRLRDLLSGIAELGYPLETLPLSEWRERIRANPANAAYPLLPLLGADGAAATGGLADVVFGAGRARAALAPAGIECPPIPLRTYIDAFTRSGFLPAPVPLAA